MEFYKVFKLFESTNYLYALTLNPNPQKEYNRDIDRLYAYFKKKNINYWMIKCQSDNGFIHWHGMIQFKRPPPDSQKFKKAIAKQINTYIGRCPEDCMVHIPTIKDMNRWYNYVLGNSNLFLEESKYDTFFFDSEPKVTRSLRNPDCEGMSLLDQKRREVKEYGNYVRREKVKEL